MKVVYLRKAGDGVISHCKCGDGLIAFPAQMDCPWCGCGWLFSCITCRKAFTFAEGVEIETAWEDLARVDRTNYRQAEPSEDEVHQWIETMKIILKDVRVGERYVILDGVVLGAEERDVEFEGWHSYHRFGTLPQFEALDDLSVLKETLDNRAYWMANALPRGD